MSSIYTIKTSESNSVGRKKRQRRFNYSFLENENSQYIVLKYTLKERLVGKAA